MKIIDQIYENNYEFIDDYFFDYNEIVENLEKKNKFKEFEFVYLLKIQNC